MKTVTFDTNTFGVLIVNDKGVADDLKVIGASIRQEIVKKNIKGFISEASVFVECLGFAEKLAYLAVAGTPDSRPLVDQRRTDTIQELRKLGLEMLHAPLIGSDIFIKMPWAKDDRYSIEDRLARFNAICRKYGHPQETVDKLKFIGEELIKTQPPLPPNRRWQTDHGFKREMKQKWAIALKRKWDNGTEAQRRTLRRKLNPIIGEWCDSLIVSSHYAYGNDFFCTNDEGRASGSNSLLHHLNRENLERDGIKIVSPKDLLNCL